MHKRIAAPHSFERTGVTGTRPQSKYHRSAALFVYTDGLEGLKLVKIISAIFSLNGILQLNTNPISVLLINFVALCFWRLLHEVQKLPTSRSLLY